MGWEERGSKGNLQTRHSRLESTTRLTLTPNGPGLESVIWITLPGLLPPKLCPCPWKVLGPPKGFCKPPPPPPVVFPPFFLSPLKISSKNPIVEECCYLKKVSFRFHVITVRQNRTIFEVLLRNAGYWTQDSARKRKTNGHNESIVNTPPVSVLMMMW